MNNDVGRRNLLKAAGAVTAAPLIAGCAPALASPATFALAGTMDRRRLGRLEVRSGDDEMKKGRLGKPGASITAALLGLVVIVTAAGCTTQKPAMAPLSLSATAATEVQELSRKKWRWMADCNLDSLGALFHSEAVFVHMGGMMSRAQELEVIRSGAIHYKSAEIQKVSVRFAGTTAIVLNTIRLVAVVGGNEVVNPFEVTEVYVPEGGAWKLASLSFTRLLR